MNFEELIDRAKFVLNANDGQANQDFSEIRIKEALNHVYTDEVNKAKQEGSRRHFKAFVAITWTSGSLTLSLPSQVSKAAIYRIEDVTDSDPGSKVVFSENGLEGAVFFKDRKTLQWGSAGPASDRTLRVFYYAKPEKLVSGEDEPELLPDDFHDLLPWSAAIYLRTIADEQAPMAWLVKQNDLRQDLWKFLSRGRPIGDETGDATAAASDWAITEATQDGSSIG